MSTVAFSTPLQRFTDGAATAVCAGATVNEVLRDADRQFPGLYQTIVRDDSVVPFVHVSVDAGTLGSAGLETPVDDRSHIRLIAAVAGG